MCYNILYLTNNILERKCTKHMNIFDLSINRQVLNDMLISKSYSDNMNQLIKNRLSVLDSCLYNIKNNYDINQSINYEELLLQLTPSNFTISAIIIARDEEQVIKRCIDSTIQFVDEIIILDTGSKDNTLKIIKSFKNTKIHLFTTKWNNDFSEARNFAMSKASSNWIFFIDADEYIDIDNLKKIISLLQIFNNSPYKHNIVFGINFIEDSNSEIGSDLTRIFYNSRNYYYYGLVHEELRSYDKINYIKTKITINHSGYSPNIMMIKNKLNRNIKLLNKMILIEPNNPRWIYYLARDGISIYDHNFLKSKIIKTIFTNNKISKQTFINSKYSLQLLDILARLNLISKDYINLKTNLELLHEFNPNSSNLLFYEVTLQIMLIKEQYQQMLNTVLNYRKNNFDLQPGMISSNGYHIDYLIAILLFEINDFKRSKLYFNYLNNKTENFKDIQEIYSLLLKNI